MRRAALLGLVMIALVAACSGGDDDTSLSGDDSTDTSTTVAAGEAEQCDGAALEASDTGITDSQIRIAIVADTGSPLRPGLFQGPVDAMESWAEWKNANGGLACREVVVETYDSLLSADEARNSVISACGSSVAMVGTAALFMNQSGVDEIEGCGIPDISVVQSEPSQQCSPMSWVILPFNSTCPYSGTGERTYHEVVGNFRYFLEEYGDLHGVWVIPSDIPSLITAIMPGFRASQQVGIGLDYEVGMSALADQSAYTPVIQEIKANQSTYARNGLDYKGTVSLRKEADVQGVDSVVVWDCVVACYDPRLISEGGDAVEGQFVNIFHLPFEDAGSNEMLDTYLGAVDRPDSFGAQAWASGELFAHVVEEIVATDGVNGVTRERILEVLPTVRDFDAGGLIPPTDFDRERPPAGCFVLLQVREGVFTRVLPEDKGEFYCPPEGEATLEITLDAMAEYPG